MVALIAFGVVIFFAHTVIHFLTMAGYSPLVAHIIPRTTMILALVALLWYARPQSMLPTGSVERPIWATWIGYLLGLVSLNVVMLLLGHDQEEVFAYSAVLSGLGFFVMGSQVWGGGYTIGLLFWLVAPMLAKFPQSSAIWFGALWGLAAGAFGARFWFLGRRSRCRRKSDASEQSIH